MQTLKLVDTSLNQTDYPWQKHPKQIFIHLVNYNN